MKKLTTEQFVNKAKSIHKNDYDYSLVIYKNNRTKIKIICPIHGEFEVLPQVHLRGSKCKFCVNNNIKLDKNTFIERANKIHNMKYDYSEIDYINNSTKIKIKCEIHGFFEQTPNSHLSGNGCIECSGLKRSTTEEFIRKSKIIHNDKFDYSIVRYINNKTKVKIICKKHGIFEQRPDMHIQLKQGCPKCSGTKKLDLNDFILKANEIHNHNYDYSKVDYRNYETKIDIICLKHGIFRQTPHAHISGQGCPTCRESKGEKIIRNFLLKNKINFLPNKTFDNCKFKRKLKFDFYLPNFNLIIEFDGTQHNKSYDFFGGDKDFIKRKIRDDIKNQYCADNKIKIIRLNNLKMIINHLKKELNING
jgi:very-short-patch-repair endonuclease